ncbi:MAG: YciI family protein [Reichenbachiella sp.]|uniref:YciI family protein n=1 Tax=Reichenbachiella sp. TaxID=2184521 RepID=UPI0032649826
MKEFMVLIRNEGNPVANLSPEQQQEHVQKVGAYIKRLMESGHMQAAQPLEMEGTMVTKKNGSFVDGPFNETKEVISGYYLLKANDLEEASSLIKEDPRFEDGDWRLEIRPIMNVEGIN